MRSLHFSIFWIELQFFLKTRFEDATFFIKISKKIKFGHHENLKISEMTKIRNNRHTILWMSGRRYTIHKNKNACSSLASDATIVTVERRLVVSCDIEHESSCWRAGSWKLLENNNYLPFFYYSCTVDRSPQSSHSVNKRHSSSYYPCTYRYAHWHMSGIERLITLAVGDE